ncbi:TonB-dependent receptor [Tellurirhabdus bombi]|uniref:TonB-dependent receptor n=1 Tax=Tellurirhabdus bombi TaxID=2907205 RepID=UPI001F2297FB|nr:TonB-dependent receptor [Tellurirhabdus bombi]
MKLAVTISLFLSLLFFNTLAQNTHKISGYVYKQGSREALSDINVYAAEKRVGTTTNADGYFSLSHPAQDSLLLTFSAVGYQTVTQLVSLKKSVTLTVYLPVGQLLREVVVHGSSKNNTSLQQMSRIEVPITKVRQIPALLGEKDVLKVLQLLPGVQKGSEGNAGIYVRGGGPDQNLILLDDAVVYNPSHLLGFFSAFNGDALEKVSLTKGGFPARFGGRLSSVIEAQMKEGSRDSLHGEAGIGLISSRLTLEGPLWRPKSDVPASSFLVSGRRTYFDVVSRPFLKSPETGESPARSYFYDLNAKLSFHLNANNKLTWSGFFGQDRFYNQRESNDTELDASIAWSNATSSLRWEHRFSERFSSNLSLLFSQYKLDVSNEEILDNNANEPPFQLRYQSGIRDFSLKYALNLVHNEKLQSRFGFQSTHHRFTPSAVVEQGNLQGSVLPSSSIEAIESGVYFEETWQPVARWQLNGGLRLSHYLVLNEDDAKNSQSTQYLRPEPRFSTTYWLPKSWALKASYALMNQYVHLLSNTGVGLPVDLWLPSTSYIKPQQSQQFVFGLAKDLNQAGILSGTTLTLEGYYKEMKNILSYAEGASFLSPDETVPNSSRQWEAISTAGRGRSYGGEALLQKENGRLSGWIGYTLSWTIWQFPELNGGRPFYPRYDRRHDISVVGIYKLRPRITLSATWVYGTGNALILPISRFSGYESRPPVVRENPSPLEILFGPGTNAKVYSERNTFRAEPYHRMDVSLRFYKRKRRHERTWEISAYNAYNRRNAFYYSVEGKLDRQDRHSRSVLYRYSVFPIVPSVSYSIKF